MDRHETWHLYVMISEAISALYFINYSHQQYLPNCIGYLNLLRLYTLDFFLHISDNKITMKEKYATNFFQNFSFSIEDP
jgi:hypothetical protein